MTAMNLAQVALNSRFCIIVDPRDARNLIGFENLTGKAINGSVKSLESSPLLTHKVLLKLLDVVLSIIRKTFVM